MQQVREPQIDDLFEMANLFPRTTDHAVVFLNSSAASA
jgi:hypothetical protein